MPTFESDSLELMFWILAALGGLLLLAVGLIVGRWIGRSSIFNAVASRERELFTAQKGFRQLYESEIQQLKQRLASLEMEKSLLTQKVDEYRKKAAGYGGLFGAGGRRADAMYALLLENEALEEALLDKNEKLKSERDDAIRETMRAASYRRVLMSHILADTRVKQTVNEILADEKRLPPAESDGHVALPARAP